MPERGSRLDHLLLLVFFPGMLALGLALDRIVLAPRRAALSAREQVEIWRTHVEGHPEFAAGLVRYGQAQLAVGDRAGASASLRRALELDPDLTTAALALSQILRDASDPRGAIAVLEALVARHPECLECLQNLAADHLALGELDRATAYIDQVVNSRALFPSATGTNFSLGLAHLLAGRIDEARGRPDSALSHYEIALRLEPQRVAVHLRIGQLLLSRDPAAAAAHLRQYRALNPADLRGALALADALGRQDDSAAALRIVQEVRVAAAQRPPAHRSQLELEIDYALASIAAQRGDLEGARRQLEALLVRAPDHAPAQTLLADVKGRIAPHP